MSPSEQGSRIADSDGNWLKHVRTLEGAVRVYWCKPGTESAATKPITLDDMKKAVLLIGDLQKWIPMEVGGKQEIIPPVKRVGFSRLLMDDVIYEYKNNGRKMTPSEIDSLTFYKEFKNVNLAQENSYMPVVHERLAFFMKCEELYEPSLQKDDTLFSHVGSKRAQVTAIVGDQVFYTDGANDMQGTTEEVFSRFRSDRIEQELAALREVHQLCLSRLGNIEIYNKEWSRYVQNPDLLKRPAPKANEADNAGFSPV